MAIPPISNARVSLDALCKHYGIDNSRRTLHGALLDSEILAEVYLELKGGKERELVAKEAWLGFYNGSLTGLVAGVGMLVMAIYQDNANSVALAAVVWMALVGACVVSGICGALIPITLKRFGLDPATASSIFLTTATDVVSMGMLLGLATVLVR